MAGHSKWSNIKHKKARVDAQRGKVFTKLAREIIVAAKQGGGDPDSNARLKTAIQKAKASNMPNDNINRAIQRGTGDTDGVNYEEVVYEGYGPGGIAVLLNITTDNRNRTAGEIRHIFSKNDGSLGETGCVAWMFDRKGLITIEMTKGLNEEELMMAALDAGADDLQIEGEVAEITTAPEILNEIREELEEADFEIKMAEVSMIPKNTIQVSDLEQVKKTLKLMEFLEDHDDVQDVYANFDIDDDLIAQIED